MQRHRLHIAATLLLLIHSALTPAHAVLQYRLEQHLFSGIVADVNQRVLPTPFQNGLITVAGDDLKIYQLPQTATPQRLTLPAFLTAPPALNSKQLFVVSEKAELLAYGRKHLKLSWRKALSNQVYAAPVADEDIVVIKVIDGMLKAFASADGQLLWQHHHPHPGLVLASDSRPLLLKNDVIALFANGRLYDYERKSGHLRWKTWLDLASFMENSLSLAHPADLLSDGERIFAAVAGKQVAAIRQQDGAVLWQRDVACDGNFLLFKSLKTLIVRDTEHTLWALHTETGETLWQQNLNEKLIGFWQIDKDIGLATEKGHLSYISASDGSVQGENQFTKPMAYIIRGLPLDYLFIARNDGIIDVMREQPRSPTSQ